jgi:triosephosphate isomerase
MTRTPFVIGNWKMNTLREDAFALAAAIVTGDVSGLDVGVCPPFPWLTTVQSAIEESPVKLGAQDCWTEKSGAFTGAVSPVMLAGWCELVIIGHSERRTIFGESDDLVAKKLSAALEAGLTPVLCVGENLELREAGEAVAFVRGQIVAALSRLTAEEIARIVVAYEPIWAIGTGKAATPADAEEMTGEIRVQIAALAGDAVAGDIRILYGGSVTPANAGEIFGQPNVDGALVGGASLKAESFLQIVAAAR